MRRTTTVLTTTAAAMSFQLVAGQTMPQSQCDFFGTAQQFIAERYPTFDSTGLRPIISETESLWELTYELPRGTLGGVPVITIDKRNCKIVRAEHSQ
ncbi:MAG: hypothetical protein QOF14_1260 [Hyphomicrobiales bacterium]|jgi:hypothetical protein|nr:hypothetical protein [Hyphomicrobiales bacterium]